MNEKTIPEQTADLFEIGGNEKQTLYADRVKGKLKYTVKEWALIETEYGKRADFVISDDYAEWKISSWNLISKEKFKPADLVGKTIQLEPIEINQKWRFKLSVLD